MFACGLDATVGVSPLDTRLLGWLTGARQAVTIRNGVDLEHFTARCPPELETGQMHDNTQVPAVPNSIVFCWGRMDFKPNVDAVFWFANRVWPLIRQQHPNTTWQIVGKNPGDPVQQLGRRPGIQVVGQVATVRPHARSAAAVVLPIMASPRAIQGLDLPPRRPLILCRTTRGSGSRPSAACGVPLGSAGPLGARARRWVESEHTWPAAAEAFVHLVNSLLPVDRADIAAPRFKGTCGAATPWSKGQQLSRRDAA